MVIHKIKMLQRRFILHVTTALSAKKTAMATSNLRRKVTLTFDYYWYQAIYEGFLTIFPMQTDW